MASTKSRGSSSSTTAENDVMGHDTAKKSGLDIEGNSDEARLESQSQREYDEDGTELKLDRYGLPLQPQPSKFKDDPLVGAEPST